MSAGRVEDRLALAVALLFALLPLVVGEGTLSGLAIYFSYALLALSLAFVWGHCGLLSLGHAVFFGVGAYAMSVTTLGMIPGLPGLVSTWVGLALALLLPALLALLIGLFLFSSNNLRGAFFGIVTLAMAFVAERLAINWDYLGGLNGLMNVPPIVLGLNGQGPELWDPLPVYGVVLVMLILGYLVLRRVVRSDFGLALEALRQNEERCRAFGYVPARLKTRAYAISAALAGLAGALFVVQFGFASPALIGFGLSAEALSWVAVGGRGSLLAAALGAVIVRLLEERLSGVLGDAWLLALGLLFIASVMFLPRGLIGEPLHRLQRVLR